LQIPNKVVNYRNTIHSDDKQKKKKIESNIDHYVSKKNLNLNWPALLNNELQTTKQIRNGFKIKKRESGHFKSKKILNTNFGILVELLIVHKYTTMWDFIFRLNCG